MTRELRDVKARHAETVAAVLRRHRGEGGVPAAHAITVSVVPVSRMTYDTLDDYDEDDLGLRVTVADTGHKTYTRLLLIHALVESLLASAEGVRPAQITAFDLAHPEADEPGERPDAPYRDAHLVAKGVEMMLCGYLGIPWTLYEAHLEHLFAEERPDGPR